MRVPYSTTNETRDVMIMRAAAKLAKIEPPVELKLEAAQKLLPEGFDLDETEWQGILGNFAPDEPVEYDYDGDPNTRPQGGGVLLGASKPLKDFAPLHANGAAPPHVDPPKAKLSLDFDGSVAALRALHTQLAEDRNVVMALTRTHQQKKAVLARAIESWQSGAVVGDAEQQRMNNVRDHLVGAQADRAKRMEGIPAELRGKYGPAAAFVRKQRSVPPGVNPDSLRKGESRGAAPASMRTLPGVGVK